MGYILGEKIIKQIKQVKEERRYLERIREELMRKVEKLSGQNKLKPYHGKVYYISFVTIKKTWTGFMLFNVYYFTVVISVVHY